MRSLQIGGKAQPCKHHQRNGLIAQGARDWRDGAVEEITVENRAVGMLFDQGKRSDVRLSGAKSDPAIFADRLDEGVRYPIIVLGDEDSFPAQHGCHLAKGRPWTCLAM